MLVDDHPIVRDGLATVLGDQADLEVVAGVASLAEARLRFDQARPAVVLLDLELPDGSGLSLVPEFAERAGVVILTAYDRDHEILEALRAGARGYLLKGVASAEIVAAVRAVAQGDSFLDSRLAGRVATRLARGPSLSLREREVLDLLAEGFSNKEIAARLSVVERTIKFHVSSLMTKLEADNRTQVVTRALAIGLL